MSHQQRLGLSLYTNYDTKRASLVKQIASVTGGEITGKIRIDVDTSIAKYYVGENDEFSRSQVKKGGLDAFLYSRYIVDVEPKSEQVQQSSYLSEVKTVVMVLRENGASVVAVGTLDSELNMS